MIQNNDIDIHDRVAEAYYGKFGKLMQEQTRKRMHWIRDYVTGNIILDIGCSQGIGPILLGREGKVIIGVDISQQAVDEANKALSYEEDTVQRNVSFIKTDFLEYSEEKRFNTITMTEVLEHLTNPDDFIKKAYDLLAENGRLIVTVPFGINDFPDHKKTYYYSDLYLMLYKFFDIIDVSFMGKWIGFIATKRISPAIDTPTNISFQSLKSIEDAFYVIERELVNSNKYTSESLYDCRKKFREVSAEKTELNSNLDKSNKQVLLLKSELSDTHQRIHLIYNSASYKLGYNLLHERSALLRPKILLKKIKTLLKMKKQRQYSTNRESHADEQKQIIPTVKHSVTSTIIEEETTLSALGWNENIDQNKPTVMAIFDEFTHSCFQYHYNLIEPRPDNWQGLLDKYHPVMLFIESTWKGNFGSWQYRVAKYAHPPGNELEALIQKCKDRNIPTLLWNKEDPVHFQNFKHIAPMVDHVFTSAYEAIQDYKKIGASAVTTLQFAAEEHLHNPLDSTSRENLICFAGSYYANRFKERRDDQLMILRAAKDFGLRIFDRNYNPESVIRSDFSFPESFDPYIVPGLPYTELLKFYKKYKVFVNVNSIIDSKTMFSRRVFELLACGTPVVSTQALGIEETFGNDIIWIVKNEKEAKKAFDTLINDPLEWRRRSLKGIRAVFTHHTYAHRAKEIQQTVFGQKEEENKRLLLFAEADNEKELIRLSEMHNYQNTPHIKSILYVLTKNEDLEALQTDIQKVIMIPPASSFKKMVEKIIVEKEPDFFALLCLNAVYGQHFIHDAVIALQYSNAIANGKDLSTSDTYSYVEHALHGSVVCDYQKLKSTKLSIRKFLTFMLDPEHTSSKIKLFVADAANFLKTKAFLSADQYNTKIHEIEV